MGGVRLGLTTWIRAFFRVLRGSPDKEDEEEMGLSRDPSEPDWSWRNRKKNLELTQQRPDEQRFTVQGGDDARTMKIEYWVRGQIPPDGVTHETLIDILDRAVELPKEGAFLEDGKLGDVKGQPCDLDEDWERAGYMYHPDTRDRVERVVL